MTASMEEQEADQLRLAVAESMCRSPVGPITHNLRQLCIEENQRGRVTETLTHTSTIP